MPKGFSLWIFLVFELIIGYGIYLLGVVISDSWVISEWRTGLTHLAILSFIFMSFTLFISCAEGVE